MRDAFPRVPGIPREHDSPLYPHFFQCPDGLYRIFWQFPVSQFLASAFIGVLWGYVYVRRGYETVVLAHTLSDWIPFLLFA